jgi:hypothetical protein
MRDPKDLKPPEPLERLKIDHIADIRLEKKVHAHFFAFASEPLAANFASLPARLKYRTEAGPNNSDLFINQA